MKFNLKNRPPLEDFKASETDPEVEREIQQCIEWFEGFEKELRERWERIDGHLKMEYTPYGMQRELKAEVFLIREILGDILGEGVS